MSWMDKQRLLLQLSPCLPPIRGIAQYWGGVRAGQNRNYMTNMMGFCAGRSAFYLRLSGLSSASGKRSDINVPAWQLVDCYEKWWDFVCGNRELSTRNGNGLDLGIIAFFQSNFKAAYLKFGFSRKDHLIWSNLSDFVGGTRALSRDIKSPKAKKKKKWIFYFFTPRLRLPWYDKWCPPYAGSDSPSGTGTAAQWQMIALIEIDGVLNCDFFFFRRGGGDRFDDPTWLIGSDFCAFAQIWSA